MAGRPAVPWPSWRPRCAGRCSPGPGLPREEGRRVLENVTLLLEALDALSERAQLLALGAGQPVIALPAVALALATPVPQRLRRHPQALGDVRDRAALTDQLQRLPPELLRIGRPRLRHRCPSLPRRFRRKRSGLRKIGGIPMVIGAFVRGLSMRDVESLCEQAGLGKVSKSTAARICTELRERFEAFQRRDLYEIHLAALLLDATFLAVRPNGPREVCWSRGALTRR